MTHSVSLCTLVCSLPFCTCHAFCCLALSVWFLFEVRLFLYLSNYGYSSFLHFYLFCKSVIPFFFFYPPSLMYQFIIHVCALSFKPLLFSFLSSFLNRHLMLNPLCNSPRRCWRTFTTMPRLSALPKLRWPHSPVSSTSRLTSSPSGTKISRENSRKIQTSGRSEMKSAPGIYMCMQKWQNASLSNFQTKYSLILCLERKNSVALLSRRTVKMDELLKIHTSGKNQVYLLHDDDYIEVAIFKRITFQQRACKIFCLGRKKSLAELIGKLLRRMRHVWATWGWWLHRCIKHINLQPKSWKIHCLERKISIHLPQEKQWY